MNRLFILISGLLLLATACTEKIDVKLDSTYTRLVVDGNIAADTGVYRISLTKSADYFYNSAVPRVVNAHVYMSDGTDVFPLTETQPGISGIYQTSSSFAGRVGNTYTLHVELADQIGSNQTYEASSKLNSVAHLDSIGTAFHPDWGKEGVWGIKVWTQEPGDEKNYYLFNVYKNGVLLTDTINKKVISEDKFYNGSYMNGVEAVYLNNGHKWESLKPGDTVTLEMSGITKEYFDFLTQVRQSGFSIPFFSGPPANVQGNINNGGIGFFTAWSTSSAKTIVK